MAKKRYVYQTTNYELSQNPIKIDNPFEKKQPLKYIKVINSTRDRGNQINRNIIYAYRYNYMIIYNYILLHCQRKSYK